MASNKRTYIVNRKVRNGFQSLTLIDYCKLVGIKYNTILARIWRSFPEITEGVIYFAENDPLLDATWQHTGNPLQTGKTAARHNPLNKIRVSKHSKLKPGLYKNGLK